MFSQQRPIKESFVQDLNIVDRICLNQMSKTLYKLAVPGDVKVIVMQLFGIMQWPLLCNFTCRALGLKHGLVFDMHLLLLLCKIVCYCGWFQVIPKFRGIQNSLKVCPVKVTVDLLWNIILNWIQKILSILECLH